MCRDKPKEWPNWIALAEYWYNNSYHTAINNTPFQVVFGQPPPAHIIYIHGESPLETMDRSLVIREAAIELLKFHLQRAQNRMKMVADKRRSEREFMLHGGYVDCGNDVWRMQGSLGVSRAIGDRHLGYAFCPLIFTMVVLLSQDTLHKASAKRLDDNNAQATSQVTAVPCVDRCDKPHAKRTHRQTSNEIQKNSRPDISVIDTDGAAIVHDRNTQDAKLLGRQLLISTDNLLKGIKPTSKGVK
ncbi:retrotransposable element Tf2 [Tanacetum coccineum]|uniref:Retrotransposable element Tf2 n=1 Tax=Tanacetum coccineum TaxID=301880 RepID=A0ABQ5AYS6_9ASTR